ncbi:unnamed protein product [Discosporangium mesarthrocarpum]
MIGMFLCSPSKVTVRLLFWCQLPSGSPLLSPPLIQEAGNVPYVTEGGLGLYSRKPAEIASAVSELLGDPARLEAMGRKALEMGRSEATIDIARELVNTLLPQAATAGAAA